jgi:hypothetical protein
VQVHRNVENGRSGRRLDRLLLRRGGSAEGEGLPERAVPRIVDPFRFRRESEARSRKCPSPVLRAARRPGNEERGAGWLGHSAGRLTPATGSSESLIWGAADPGRRRPGGAGMLDGSRGVRQGRLHAIDFASGRSHPDR